MGHARALAAMAWVLCASAQGAVPARPIWTSSTSLRPIKPHAGERIEYNNESVRQDIRVQAAGRLLRFHLTNELGDAPVTLGHVGVSVQRADGTAGTPFPLSFDGRPDVTIEPGAQIVSDPLSLPLSAFADLIVTAYYPGPASPVAHRPMVRVAAGDTQPAGAPVHGPGIVSEIDALDAHCGRVIVAFGDSITEGAGSTPHNDWPAALARRLTAPHCPPTVVNAGISGNQVLRSGGSPSALARFDRDVLALPGVTDIIMIEGINDIRSWEGPDATRHGTAEDLIAGYRQIVARAHAHGIRVIGGTLTPYEGTGNQSAAGLATVAAVNAAIRGGRIFDAHVEFNHAVADPADPQRMRADVQKGDWLHPNDKGYAAMAAAVPLALFAPERR